MRLFQIPLAAVMVIAWMGCAQARVQPTHGFDLFSSQEEIQAGQQAAAQVMEQLPMLPENDPITKYVQQLGAKLAEHAPGEKWPYSFHVVNQKEINAFALPGGPIFVNLGAIQAADNEAQLAGVLAHEISHVVQRHGTRAASKQMAAQLPLALITGMMGNTTLARATQLGISFGVGSYFLRNSRQSESEADLLGADIMYDSGFDPHQMAVFFAKLQEQAGKQSAVAQFLSDHPDPGNRAGAISREVAALPAKKYRSSSEEFAAIKKQAEGAQAMTAEQVEAWRKEHEVASSHPESYGDKPVALTGLFNHSYYQISYPENWQVAGDANSAVTIAPKNGVSKEGVVYGVIINSYRPDTADSDAAEIQKLVAFLQQSNAGLQVIGNAQDIRVNGHAGKSVDLLGRSPEQALNGKKQHERDWLVAIKRDDGSLLYMVFAAPESDFEAMRPAFEQMLKSLVVK